MIKIRKTGTLALAGLLGAALLTGGAFAYFTDADSAVNTFTVGSVKIDLQEPGFNEDEGINITPGKTVEKDPQILNTGNNDAFVYMQIGIPTANVVTVDDSGVKKAAASAELFSFTLNNGWTQVGDRETDGALNVYTYAYTGGSAASLERLAAGDLSEALFDSVTFANIVEDQGLENVNKDITVTAFAIQADDLSADTPDAVWQIIKNQAPASDDRTGEDESTDIA